MLYFILLYSTLLYFTTHSIIIISTAPPKQKPKPKPKPKLFLSVVSGFYPLAPVLIIILVSSCTVLRTE